MDTGLAAPSCRCPTSRDCDNQRSTTKGDFEYRQISTIDAVKSGAAACPVFINAVGDLHAFTRRPADLEQSGAAVADAHRPR
mmetsp:Transcript_94792/g.267823  ORF Transcript_94792/g.267823 Transcript_94792/m.267823 type:complete len:82 (+) Transcript_94792:1927-2172(+)